jgi:hypothetical protein
VKERREIERSSISHWRPRATSAFAAIELHVLSLSIFLAAAAAAAAAEKTDSRPFVFEPLL